MLVAGLCCRNEARHVSVAVIPLASTISEEVSHITLICAFPTDVAIVLGLSGSWNARISLFHGGIGLDCGANYDLQLCLNGA